MVLLDYSDSLIGADARGVDMIAFRVFGFSRVIRSERGERGSVL